MKLISTTAAALITSLFVTQALSAPLGTSDTDINGSTNNHVKRQCIPNGSFYDDASYKVPLEYIGAWTHLTNQGSAVKSGTLSYTGQANA